MDVIAYDFKAKKDLIVKQETHAGEGSFHINTAGEIHVRRLPKDSKYGAHFTIDVRVSDPDLDIRKTWDDGTHTLKISTPRKARIGSISINNCISLGITVWLPEDALLANLDISAVTLNLRVMDDLKIDMAGFSKLSSISGDISFPTFSNSDKPASKENELPPAFVKPNHSFSSRRIDIESVSGSISGVFPLYDHLGLHSTSGNIKVGVVPKPVDTSAPKSAELEIGTSSGDISANLPLTSLKNTRYIPPPRDYVTRAQTNSGDFSGSLYQGSIISFKSTSGNFKSSILPIFDAEAEKSGLLETLSTSGDTQILVLEPVYVQLSSSKQPDQRNEMPTQPKKPESPYRPIGDDDPYLLFPPKFDGALLDKSVARSNDDEKKLRTLRSSHKSTSGKISVGYPKAWEGTISGKTTSGGISVTGEGVNIIRVNNGIIYKEIVAKKGVDREGEGSNIEMITTSGGIKFTIA